MQTRAKLHIDPSAPPAATSTPSPSTASTLVSPLTNRPSSAGSQSTEDEDDKGPVKPGAPEKPKRCRVTPEQLVHLERFFAAERSPTATRRREISDLLGMQERQTQIWFQNRRAKAKLQNSKIKKAKDMCQGFDTNSLPQLSMSFENELNNLIHEDEPVTYLPCSHLTIGCWRRITTDANQRDLVAYTCDTKRCLVWFIHNGGFGFKMEVPFDTIIHAEFTSMAPGPNGLASFVLSRAPIFYLESASDDSFPRRWKRSTDWTEGHQASQVLRHDLIGNAASLAFLVQSLQTNAAEAPSPYSPLFNSEPPSPMEIPPPPLSIIQRSMEEETNKPDSTHIRRRSLASNDLSQLVVTGLSQYRRELPHTAPAMTYTHTSFLPLPAPTSPLEEPTLADFGAGVISHNSAPRSFLAQPVPRHFYDKPMSTPFLFNPLPNPDLWTDADARMFQAETDMGFCMS
ncbi:U1 snRNP 70K protein [Mycena kentingensis (nom. inval.)]|nr:U1 snRNP 70K protein [Mycena kentingensis (nom. inval.)]